MALEPTVNYFSDFDISWPTPSDPKSAGDDHIRNIKKALRQTFPLFTGVMNIAHDQVASKQYVQDTAFSTALPGQPGGTPRYDLVSEAGVAQWLPRSTFADLNQLAEAHAIALSF